MKKLALPIALFLIVALIATDSYIKAQNTARRVAAENRAQSTGQQVETSLAKLLEATSRNASAKASARALQLEYAKTPQTSAGVQAFRTTLSKLKPQIIRPLVEPSRSSTDVQLFTLTSSVDGHAEALSSKENAESTSGGLFAKLQRDFGLVESP